MAGLIKRVLRKQVTKNFFSLMSVQLIINLTSLLLVPHLSKSLEANIWGVYLISQALMNFVTPIMDFGFDYSGTRYIAQNRDENDKVSEFTSVVIVAKGLLILVILIVTSAFYFVYPPLRDYPEFFFLAVMSGVVSGMTPWWYFQGREKMFLPSLITIILYITYGTTVILFVNEPAEGWRIWPIYIAINILINIILFTKIFGEVKFIRPKIGTLKEKIKESSVLFVVKFTEIVSNSAGVIFLGLFVNTVGVSYFGNAQKVMKIPRITLNTLVRILFPKISKLVNQPTPKAFRTRWRILFFTVVISSLGSSVLFIFSENIVFLIFGPSYEETVILLKWIVWIIPLFSFNRLIAVLWFAASKKDKAFLKVNLYGVLVNLLLLILCLHYFGLIGIAYSVIFSEILKSIITTYYWKNEYKTR